MLNKEIKFGITSSQGFFYANKCTGKRVLGLVVKLRVEIKIRKKKGPRGIVLDYAFIVSEFEV